MFSAAVGKLCYSYKEISRMNERCRDELRSWHGLAGLPGGMILISEPLGKPEYQTDESLRMLEIITPAALKKGRPFQLGTDRQYKRFGLLQKGHGVIVHLLLCIMKRMKKKTFSLILHN